ncbi:MAG: putative membrane protein YeiB, partial [Paraglaciecola sp.]
MHLFYIIREFKTILGYYFLSPELAGSFNTAGLDKVLRYFQSVFIEGKFYTLFSLLSSIGMVIEYQSFKHDISVFNHYMRKRLTVLLLIGIFHFSFLGIVVRRYTHYLCLTGLVGAICISLVIKNTADCRYRLY